MTQQAHRSPNSLLGEIQLRGPPYFREMGDVMSFIPRLVLNSQTSTDPPVSG